MAVLPCLSGRSASFVCRISRPSSPLASHVQPEPNRVFALSVKVCLNWSTEPNACSMAVFSSPSGSPGSPGVMQLQKNVWFHTWAELLNSPPGPAARMISSSDLPSFSVPSIRPLRLVTYVWWCLPWWKLSVCSLMWGARASLGYGSGGSSNAIGTPWVVGERVRTYPGRAPVARAPPGTPAGSLTFPTGLHGNLRSGDGVRSPMVRRLAVLSLHTSPLAQPGAGDSGGMNVYVRELVSALAQAGVTSDVYTRRWTDDLPDVVDVEPGFRVVHVPAGPLDLRKEALPQGGDEFADGVLDHLLRSDDLLGVDALHANYWLSGVAGHRLKHELELPLVSTFHTLARVKAETGDPEPQRRIDAETQVIGCSDAILANCPAEAAQLERLYGADPARIEIVPPGVVHAFFSPGDRAGARAALPQLSPDDGPMLLFVGRIQPLQRLDVAVRAPAELDDPTAVLVVVGGASGADGRRQVERIEKLAATLGGSERG